MFSRQNGSALLRTRQPTNRVASRSRARRRRLWLEQFEERTMFVVYFTEAFANNTQGWTLDTEWQIGPAAVSTGHNTGFADPATDNTPTADNGVAGVVIGGNATTALHGFYYLTSPVINTAGAPTLTLSFARWLNSDYTPWMQNTIEVFNGSTWNPVFLTGPAPGITENAWTPQTYDILAYSNAALQVRFGVLVGSAGAFNASSWNIDDVVVQTASNDTFAYALPLPSLQTAGATGTSAGATGETGEPPNVNAATSNPINSMWWTWTAPASGTVEINTQGSSFDTTLGVYTGNVVSALTAVAANDDFYGVQSAVTFTAVAGTTYRISVDGYQPATGSIALNVLQGNDLFARAITLNGNQFNVTANSSGATGEVGEPNNAGVSVPLQSLWWNWTPTVSGNYEISTQGSVFDTTLGVHTGAAVNALTTIASNDDFYGLQSSVTITAVAGTTYRISVDSYQGEMGAIALAVIPFNDNFALARNLPALMTASGTGSTIGTTGEVGEPANVNAATSNPINSAWWNWTAPVSGTVEINTQGSGFDTTLGVYTGTAVNALTTIASNDDFYGLQSAVTFTAVAGTTYRISVDGYTTATGAVVVNVLQVNDQFARAFNLNGDVFNVTANNTGATGEVGEPNNAGTSAPLQSLWWNWTPTTTGTFQINTLGSVLDTTLGVYTGTAVNALTLVASNDDVNYPALPQSSVTIAAVAGTTYRISVDSYQGLQGPIVLSIAPFNDNFAQARTLLPWMTISGFGTLVGTTGEVGEPPNVNAATSNPINSAWWNWTAPVSGTVEINTVGSTFDTTLGVYTGTAVNSLTTIGSNDDFYGVQSRVVFTAVAGTTYRISVDGYTTATGSVIVNVLQVNDQFARAFTLTGPITSTTANNTGATVEIGEPLITASSSPANSLWWNWTAPLSGTTEINTQGSAIDTTLGIYTGTAVTALTLVGVNDDFYGLQSRVLFTAVAGTTYRIAVDGYQANMGAITLNVIQSAQDYDDAPASFGTASHNTTGVTLGLLRDPESVTYDSATANGDDITGTDDEDGVTMNNIAPGGTGTAVVNAQGVGATAFLQGWIDFNNDGVFGAGEQIATNLPVAASGNQTVTFAVPPTAVVGSRMSRFRISTTSGLGATGTAADGEVEDQLVTVAIPTTVYVSPTFTTAGASVDGDLTAAGVQTAVVGFNSFATVTQGLAVLAVNGTAIVNTAIYAEAPVVATTLTEFRSYSATMNSLTTNAAIGLSGTLSTTPGGLDFNSPITLLGNTVLNSAAVVDFTGANVNALSAGAQSLTISAPAANVTLAAVGAAVPVSTLSASANVLSGSAILNTTSGATLTVASGSTISGAIQGAGGLIKAGAGTLTISATNTFTGATSVNAGTLQLQNGAAILDTAGAVSVALGATLQLLSNETVSSYVGGGDIGAGTNDSTLALGNSILTTTGTAAIGNVTSGSTGGIIAGTTITDSDDDNNVTGTGIFLQASAGVGVIANPIETTVANLESSGGSGGVYLANTGNLVIGGVSALTGLTATGGDIVVSSAGSLTLNENVSATGAGTDVLLTTIDSAAAGQNLILPAGVTVSSAAASVLFNSGDDITIAGNVSSATTTTFNVDAGNLDPAVGGNLSISGIITTPTVGGGAFLNGQTDNDTFTFNPQTTTEFRLFGDSPVGVTPGDSLVMNITGTANPNLTVPGSIAPYSGLGSGAWSFTSPHKPVLFGSIELSTITGNYHLTYDNSVSPVSNLVVMRDSAAPTANLQLRNGSTAGAMIFQSSMSSILSLRILGSAGSDTVTVDDINTLPNFSSTVPGVGDNANVAGTAELLFDGLGGADTLVYNLIGTAASQQYAVGNGTGGGSSEGEIESVAAGVNLLAYFQNVESTQRTGSGTVPGGLTIIGDLNANLFGLQASGATTQATVSSFTPFSFSGNNYSAITLNALAGADTLDLLSLGTGQTNNPAITFSGGTEVDTLRVRSTSGNTGLVTLIGGAGSDAFQLYDAANTVDGIAGNVVIDGTDGVVVNNTDTLVIIDSGDLTADNVLISAVNAATSADYFIEGITSSVGTDVIFRNIDDLTYTATSASDTIDARFVNTVPMHDLGTISLSGWTGGDQFLLFTSDQFGGSGAGVTPSGVASGLATISLYGDAPGNPNAGDGNDIFGATPVGLSGTGFANVGLAVPATTRMIRPSATTSIAIDGGEPSGLAVPVGDAVGDVTNIDVTALPTNVPLLVSTVSPGTVLSSSIQSITWTQVEDINLVNQGVMTNVQMGDLFSRGTPGNDLVQFMLSPLSGNANAIRVRIGLSVYNFGVPGKTVVYTGDGNDYITQGNLPLVAEFYGEGNDDYLSGALNNDWLSGGLGDDQINGSGGNNIIWGDNVPTLPSDPFPQDSAVGGSDKLSGLSGNDVFYGGAGDDEISAGEGNDYISGGRGNDTLDGHIGDDRIYGGIGDDVLGGGSGNDLLSGNDGSDKLMGGTGNDVLIAGTGADEISGGDGSDLIITGSVANDASTWSGSPASGPFAMSTYINPADNDSAMLTLLSQWSSASNRSSLGAISHDSSDDDFFGGTGDDDFCYENFDILDDIPAPAGPDFNATGMGSDERFGPFN